MTLHTGNDRMVHPIVLGKAGVARQRKDSGRNPVMLDVSLQLYGWPRTLVDGLPFPPDFLLYPLAPRLHLTGHADGRFEILYHLHLVLYF